MAESDQHAICISGLKRAHGAEMVYSVQVGFEDLEVIEVEDKSIIGATLSPDVAEQLGLELIRTAAIMRQLQSQKS